MAIINEEALRKRARDLTGSETSNGINLVLVDLSTEQAFLEVHFFNRNAFDEILDAVSTNHSVAKQLFPLSGGRRVPAGPGAKQVQVVSVKDSDGTKSILHLVIEPIGDYSTYTLNLATNILNTASIDPLFDEIEFKFRPGCFNLCAPEWASNPEPIQDPKVDYLAKDYDSFKHTMIAAMMERVPDWKPTSEADLDQVLLELFSASADELSDYQDRVMNEAYLSTARKRVSLARHARLMDYHIHQGNQATTWLALIISDNEEVDLRLDDDSEFKLTFWAWAGHESYHPSDIIFITREEKLLHHLLNQLSLYTWSDAIPSLAAGSTTADLKLAIGGSVAANTVQNLIRNGTVQHLLIQEELNPATGEQAGRDPLKRQLLSLLSGDEGAASQQDPITGEWFVRVRWQEKDKLRNNYCFTVDGSDGPVEDVSRFYGNLVQVYHGHPASAVFKEPDTPLNGENERYYERTEWGAICQLPENPLAYLETPSGGEVPPQSTLMVETPGDSSDWQETISLIHSDASDQKGSHFLVETDEKQHSQIRFGNGVNGKKLPNHAEVHCTYQVGYGPDGNLGRDKLIHFDNSLYGGLIELCWNPFDITNGRAPEPVAEIIRRAPEAYLTRQLRAVTLQDYINCAEELEEVSRAAARYVWAGSWRAVRIAIDPLGTTELSDELRLKITDHLNAVRLIGEGLEVRPPKFVPLEIHISLCALPDIWPEDIQSILEQEFSEGFTPDGRKAFFHPDLWTFGQKLYTSQLIGRAQSIEGVDHVTAIKMKRWNDNTPGTEDVIEVRTNEICQVRNNPDHLEEGFIFFEVQGGSQ